MVVRKSRKCTKYRGSKTHGCGSMKKRRGAGNRGGRGNAGRGKRGTQKMQPKFQRKFEHKGFDSKVKRKIIFTDLAYLNKNIEKLAEEGKITKEGDIFVIDCKKLGFNRVLGTGKLSHKIKITAEHFSAKAKEKITNAGGEAIEQ